MEGDVEKWTLALHDGVDDDSDDVEVLVGVRLSRLSAMEELDCLISSLFSSSRGAGERDE